LNERVIELEEIAASEFFGTNNRNIELIKKHFPKLKIVARDNKVRIIGNPLIMDEFEKRFAMLTKYFHRYNKLDENSIEQILSLVETVKNSIKEKDILVHGVNGKYIKARICIHCIG